MTMGLKEVVSGGPLNLMSPSIGFQCAMIGLKKSLKVGAGKIRITLLTRGRRT